MHQKENNSISKIDEQIKKLKKNSYKDSNDTPILNKRDLVRKVRIEKLNQEVEKNKRKKKNKHLEDSLEKTIVMDKINNNFEQNKEKELRKLYKDKSVIFKGYKKRKTSGLDKKGKVKEILEDERKTKDIIKKLSCIFLGLFVLIVVIFILICII